MKITVWKIDGAIQEQDSNHYPMYNIHEYYVYIVMCVENDKHIWWDCYVMNRMCRKYHDMNFFMIWAAIKFCLRFFHTTKISFPTFFCTNLNNRSITLSSYFYIYFFFCWYSSYSIECQNERKKILKQSWKSVLCCSTLHAIKLPTVMS